MVPNKIGPEGVGREMVCSGGSRSVRAARPGRISAATEKTGLSVRTDGLSALVNVYLFGRYMGEVGKWTMITLPEKWTKRGWRPAGAEKFLAPL